MVLVVVGLLHLCLPLELVVVEVPVLLGQGGGWARGSAAVAQVEGAAGGGRLWSASVSARCR